MTVSINGSGGITYPDGSVNTTRSASTAGDTFTGPVQVSGRVTVGRQNSISEGGEIALNNHTGADDFMIDRYNGDTRYYHGSAYSHIFATANTNRMIIDGLGRVAIPYQPMFCGVASYGTSYSGSLDPMNFNSSIYENTGSAYATSGGNAGKYICPIAGRYFITLQGHVQNNGGYTTIRAVKNGVTHSNAWQIGCSSEITTSALIYCGAGDSLYGTMATSQTNYISESYWTLTIMFMG